MNDDKEEKGLSRSNTVALAETEGVLYFKGGYDVNGKPILLQNKSLVQSLEESGIRIKAFSNFSAENMSGSGDLPIHYFFQEKNCSFWTKYDPYYAGQDVEGNTEPESAQRPKEEKKTSWKDYYEPPYTEKNSRNLFCIAAARDVYYQVFANIRLIQLGILDKKNIAKNITIDDFSQSEKELNMIIENQTPYGNAFHKEARAWKDKLGKLKELVIEQIVEKPDKKASFFSKQKPAESKKNKYQFKSFSNIPEIMTSFEEFYKDEFAIVNATPSLAYKVSEYKGDIRLFKGDLFAFALDRLYKDGVKNIILFEKNENQIKLILKIYDDFCKNEKYINPPNLAVYHVGDSLYDPCKVVFSNENFPKSELIKLDDNLKKNQLLPPPPEDNSDDESESEVDENEQLRKAPNFSCCQILCCCLFHSASGLVFISKKSFLPVVGVMTSLGFIGSFLNESQNQVLFKGFSDGLRDDFIASLMTPCAHAPGNYASYVTGAVLILLLMYYKRDYLKEKFDDLKEGFMHRIACR